MSDDGPLGGPSADDDLSLPKATVQKLISGPSLAISHCSCLTRRAELLPKDVVCAKETRDLIIECCVGKTLSHSNPLSSLDRLRGTEFIHMISTEANEICEQESKKTIAPEHILSALRVGNPSIFACTDNTYMKPQKLGFESFMTDVEDVLKDHKIQQKVRIPPDSEK